MTDERAYLIAAGLLGALVGGPVAVWLYWRHLWKGLPR